MTAVAFRALDKGGHANDGIRTCFEERWPCTAANNAALALEVHGIG